MQSARRKPTPIKAVATPPAPIYHLVEDDRILVSMAMDGETARSELLARFTSLRQGRLLGKNARIVVERQDESKRIFQSLMASSDKILKEIVEKLPAVSHRQKQVLEMVIDGVGNKEIAAFLNITVRTVKFHVSQILLKYGVTDRYQLAKKAQALRTVHFSDIDVIG